MQRALIPSLLVALAACSEAGPAPGPTPSPGVVDPAPAAPKPATPKPEPGPAPEPLLLTEELARADALVFVPRSVRESMVRGDGRYTESMVIVATPDEVVFATPAIPLEAPLTIEVPYAKIMTRMGGTPNTRKTGLTQPNAHPRLPMGWILDRQGERWVALAAVRALESDRKGLRQLAEATRGDPTPAELLARMVGLETSGASGLGRALGLLLVKRLEGADAARLGALVAPHAKAAAASLDPARWPGLRVFLLRHADEPTRRDAVRRLLAAYDREPDKGLVDGPTRAVLADLLDPADRRPLYPLDERDFKRIPKMDAELLARARAFASGG